MSMVRPKTRGLLTVPDRGQELAGMGRGRGRRLNVYARAQGSRLTDAVRAQDHRWTGVDHVYHRLLSSIGHDRDQSGRFRAILT